MMSHLYTEINKKYQSRLIYRNIQMISGSLGVLYNITRFNSTLLIRETSLRSKARVSHEAYMSLAERSRLYYHRHLKFCMRYISPYAQNGDGPLDSSNVNEKNKIGDFLLLYVKCYSNYTSRVEPHICHSGYKNPSVYFTHCLRVEWNKRSHCVYE